MVVFIIFVFNCSFFSFRENKCRSGEILNTKKVMALVIFFVIIISFSIILDTSYKNVTFEEKNKPLVVFNTTKNTVFKTYSNYTVKENLTTGDMYINYFNNNSNYVNTYTTNELYIQLDVPINIINLTNKTITPFYNYPNNQTDYLVENLLINVTGISSLTTYYLPISKNFYNIGLNPTFVINYTGSLDNSPNFNLATTNLYSIYNQSLNSVSEYNFNRTIIFTPSSETLYIKFLNNSNPAIMNYPLAFFVVNNFNDKSNYYVLIFTNASDFNISCNSISFHKNLNDEFILQNGSYTFSVQNSTTNVSFAFTVTINGNNIVINTLTIKAEQYNLMFIVYISFVVLAFMLFSRFFYKVFASYMLYGLLFFYIGMRLNIEFFDAGMLMIMITLVSAIFAYKLVME